MNLNIRKVYDALGYYFEINIKDKNFAYGYEGTQDGYFLDKRFVLMNESALDFMIENPDKFNWDSLYSSANPFYAKEMLELDFKQLGFNDVQFFIRN